MSSRAQVDDVNVGAAAPSLESYQLAALLQFFQTLDRWDREASDNSEMLPGSICQLEANATPAVRKKRGRCTFGEHNRRRTSLILAAATRFGSVEAGKAECLRLRKGTPEQNGNNGKSIGSNLRASIIP